MKYKKIIISATCLIMALCIVIATTWDFSRQLQRTLTRNTYQTLSNVSTDYNKAFLERISCNMRTLDVLAVGLNEIPKQDRNAFMRTLQNTAEEAGFSAVAVCNRDGLAFSNKGEVGDVSQREYFKKALKGEANVSEPLTTSVSGKESIIIAVPIKTDTSINGVLFGVYPLSTSGSKLLDFSYYSEGYGFIIAPSGKIILSSHHADKLADGDNIIDFFEKTEITGFSVEELKTALNKGESNSFAFTYEGEKRFVSFTPTTVNDWYTFSLSSDAVMRQQEKETNQIVLMLILKLALAFILVFALILFSKRRHNKEILVANQKYQSLLEHINGGVIVAVHAHTADETIATYVSSGFTAMTGYTLEDINELYGGRYLDILVEEDRKVAFDIYLQQLKIGNSYWMPYRIHKKDGSILWVMDNGYLVEDDEGLHNHSILTDITTIKQQEEELRLSENRFSVAINASSGTLFEVDLKKQLYTHFENAQRIFGVSADKLLEETSVFASLPFDEFVEAITDYFFHPDDHDLAVRAMGELLEAQTASYEARLRRFDNSYIWARIDLSLSMDEFGAPERLVGFMSDINSIKKQAELLESKVQTDPMTGLYNKIAMATLANKILNDYPDGRHALIVLDVDDFKGINDTLGHAFGDLVLIEICAKLKSAFRNNDIVGRMGGDEFAILMKNVPDTSSVLKKATELSAAFRQTYAGETMDYKISCSIGIIMIEAKREPFETLYRKADAALYRAKQNGKDQFVLYQEQDAGDYPIETTRTNDEELQNLRTSHNIEAQIFELLYTSKDFSISINMALAAIGQQYNVSRVAIFENDDDNLTISNIYEWCNQGAASQIDQMQNIPLSTGGDSIMDAFDQNGLLYCNNTAELPPYLRKIFISKGTVSTLQVIITDEERTCGIIGFDECREQRIWTSEEIEKLSFLAKVLSVFLFKKKTENALLDNLHTRLKILDVLPDYICVVNPETHSLVYANMKMQELIPDAKPGAFCFMTLRGGQQGPCETCLVERIKRGDTDNLEIVSEDKKLRLKINALSINWTKNQKMVLLYGTIK
ncbi:MAG: diguanylate cyclase [Oscillospiraceae bacterium]